MTSIREILHPEDVNLVLKASDKASAIDEVLAKLNGDERVTDWAVLRETVIQHDAPILTQHGSGICIAHGRTSVVRKLVMAAGRSEKGIPCKEAGVPLRFVFVAGIPAAFDSEYLRVVGAIARICADHSNIQRLLTAKTAAVFIDLLEAGEMKL